MVLSDVCGVLRVVCLCFLVVALCGGFVVFGIDVRCVLFVDRRLRFVACCSLCVVPCLLVVVCCLLLIHRC